MWPNRLRSLPRSPTLSLPDPMKTLLKLAVLLAVVACGGSSATAPASVPTYVVYDWWPTVNVCYVGATTTCDGGITAVIVDSATLQPAKPGVSLYNNGVMVGYTIDNSGKLGVPQSFKTKATYNLCTDPAKPQTCKSETVDPVLLSEGKQ